MATEVVDTGQTAIRLHEQHLRQGKKGSYTDLLCVSRASASGYPSQLELLETPMPFVVEKVKTNH